MTTRAGARARGWRRAEGAEIERVNPWNVLAAAAIVAATVWAAPAGRSRIAAAVLLVVAETLLVVHRRLADPARAATVAVASLLALGAVLVAPNGLAEVIFLVAVTRMLALLPAGRRWPIVVVYTLGFAAVIGWISHSWLGLLAGTGVLFLAQRTVERQELAFERDRAVRLLGELQAGQELATEAAALAERDRIARDMHDVLAHSLAGLSLQLQAVRALAAQEGVGPVVTEPLDRAAELARAGVSEARAVVGALRGPAPLGVDALESLAARFPATTAIARSGDPGRLAPEVGAAVYRAVQEALTNCARYAAGSPVTVELRWGEGELIVRVADSGPGSGRAASGVVGSGMGLLGMDERVRAVGGRLVAAPAGPGWVVELTVPAT